MIPISDKNHAQKTPFVMYFLIAVNILTYIIDHIAVDGYFTRLWNWAMVPASVISDVKMVPIITEAGKLIGFEANPAIAPHPQWITIFTSMFMHASILHIGGNMLYLWIFGNNIEDKLGHIKFLFFYLFCGVSAAFLHIGVSFATNQQYIPTVGASGAIAGVLGAYLVLFPHAKIKTLVPMFFFITFIDLPAVFVLGIWFFAQLSGIMNIGGQLGGGVAYGAHIGGFIAGIIWVLLAGKDKLLKRKIKYTTYDNDSGIWM